MYSRIKGGVAATAQVQCPLNAPSLTVRWDTNIVLNAIEPLLLYGFTAWQIDECGQYRRRDDDFRNLDAYIHRLSHTLYFTESISVMNDDLLQ